MKDLDILDIYQSADKKDKDTFKNNIDSTLHVVKNTEKVINDIEWIEMIESTIPYIDNIFRNPNRFIINEEEIVKIEKARKITVESIKNLSRNTSFIQKVDKKTGDVKPSKILNIDKEETYDTYENRLIYTLIQNAKFFISERKKLLEQYKDTKEVNDRKFDYNGRTHINNNEVNINVSLNSKIGEGSSNNEETDTGNLLERIEQLSVRISDLTASEVYKVIDKKHITLVREPIKKTNVVLKNVNFQYAMKLWDYLAKNMDDKSKRINQNEDYYDEQNLKNMMDDSFLLNYLITSSAENDKEDSIQNEELREEMQEEMINNLMEKIMDLSEDMTMNQIKKMIGEKFLVIKYKNKASYKEIENIFNQYIQKYYDKINNG